MDVLLSVLRTFLFARTEEEHEVSPSCQSLSNSSTTLSSLLFSNCHWSIWKGVVSPWRAFSCIQTQDWKLYQRFLTHVKLFPWTYTDIPCCMKAKFDVPWTFPSLPCNIMTDIGPVLVCVLSPSIRVCLINWVWWIDRKWWCRHMGVVCASAVLQSRSAAVCILRENELCQ